MGDGPGRRAHGGGPALWHIRNVSRKCGRKILVPELFAIGWNIEPEGAGDSVAGGDQVDGLQTVARGSAKRCAAKGRAGYETVSWILRDSSFSGTVSLKHREVLQSSQAGSPDARRGDVFPWERPEHADGADTGAASHVNILRGISDVDARGGKQSHLPQSKTK